MKNRNIRSYQTSRTNYQFHIHEPVDHDPVSEVELIRALAHLGFFQNLQADP